MPKFTYSEIDWTTVKWFGTDFGQVQTLRSPWEFIRLGWDLETELEICWSFTGQCNNLHTLLYLVSLLHILLYLKSTFWKQAEFNVLRASLRTSYTLHTRTFGGIRETRFWKYIEILQIHEEITFRLQSSEESLGKTCYFSLPWLSQKQCLFWYCSMCRMASDTETCAAYLIETWNFNTFRVMFPSSTPNGFLTTENDCFEWCWKSPTKTRFGCCALVYFFAGSNIAGRMWNPIYRHVFRHFSTSRIRIWRRKKLLRMSWNWHMTSFWPSRVGHKYVLLYIFWLKFSIIIIYVFI